MTTDAARSAAADSFRIYSVATELRGWQHLWCKHVRAFDPTVHCARCLVGSYAKPVNARAPVDTDVPIVGRHHGDVLYFCGVSRPHRWANNLHLAVRVTGDDDDKASVAAYTGDTPGDTPARSRSRSPPRPRARCTAVLMKRT